jgi:hypothetical protein
MGVVAAMRSEDCSADNRRDKHVIDQLRASSASRIEPGDHICALVGSRTHRDAIMRPFLTEGMSAGHKCLLGLGEPNPWQTVRTLLPTLDPEHLRSAGQLDVLETHEPQFSSDDFSVPAMLEFWTDVTDEAQAGEYEAVRLTAEARWWSPQLPQSDALIDYEAALSTFASEREVAILSVYDIEDYGWMLVDLMKTHPRVLVNEVEFANPYYARP